MTDLLRTPGRPDACQRVRVQAPFLAFAQLRNKQLPQLPRLSINQGPIAKTPLLKLQLDDAVENLAAVLRIGKGAPTPSGRGSDQNPEHGYPDA